MLTWHQPNGNSVEDIFPGYNSNMVYTPEMPIIYSRPMMMRSGSSNFYFHYRMSILTSMSLILEVSIPFAESHSVAETTTVA